MKAATLRGRQRTTPTPIPRDRRRPMDLAVESPAPDDVALTPANAANGAHQKSVQSIGRNTEADGEIDHIPEVAEIIQKPDDVPGEVETKITQRNRSDFTICGLLYYVRQHKELLNEDFGSEPDAFAAWADSRLSFGRSKAQQWAKIYEAFRRAGLGAEEFQAMGWAKAAKLCLLTPEVLRQNKDWLVKTARRSSVKGLVEGIRSRNLIFGGERIQKTTFVFKLLGEEAHTVERALARAKELVGDDDQNKALEYALGDWSNMIVNVPSSLEADIAGAVNRHGMQAVVDHVRGLAEADASGAGATAASGAGGDRHQEPGQCEVGARGALHDTGRI